MCVVAVGCGSPCTRPILAPPPHPSACSLGACGRASVSWEANGSAVPTDLGTSFPLSRLLRTILYHSQPPKRLCGTGAHSVLAPALGTWEPGYLDTWIPGLASACPHFSQTPYNLHPGCILHPSHFDLDPRALLSCSALPCPVQSSSIQPRSTSPSVPFSIVPSSALHFFPSRFKKRIHNKTVLFCPALPRPTASHGPRRDAPPLVSPSLPFPSLPPPRHRLIPL